MYNKGCCCIPDLSQQPPQDCVKCGNPVEGPNCQGCALWRKKLKEVWFTICHENGIYQDLLNTYESSDDDTNVVNAPREPFVVKQDPGKKSSQSPPHIDHNCCYECGDSLDDIFCQRCTCKSCGKGAHYGYNCPPQIPIISNPEPCYNQNLNEILQNLQSLQQQCLLGTCQQCGCNEYDGVCFYCTVGNGTQINFSTPYSSNDSPNFANHLPQPQYVPYSCELCGNDAHHGYDCPPQVPFHPPQSSDIHPHPQETSKDILQAQEDLMEAIQTFLKEYDHIPPNEKCITLLLAEERFLKIKQAMEEEQNQPEVMQELLLKLMDDLQILKGSQQEKKETAAQSFTPYWNFSMIDDEEARENFMKDICTFLRKFSRIPFGVTPKVILIAWERFGKIKDALTDEQYQQEDIQELMSKLLEDYTVIWRRPKAITPDEPSEEPEDPLIMGEEELSIIPEKDKSSVEDLVPIPSGSKGVSDDICDNDHSKAESLLSQDITITSPKINFLSEDDDDSYENIEYVEASPPDSELVSLEEVNEDQEEKEFDLEDIFQIQDVILREKLLNVHRLITNIESLKNNPTPDHVFKSPFSFPIPVTDSDSFFEESNTSFSHLDNSLPEFETFSDHTEETRSGSTTTHANNSLPEYDSFLFEIEPDQGRLTSVVISDNSNNPLLETPEFESFHFDLYDDPLFPRPPPEPPDVEISLIVETNAPMINNVGDINVEDDDSFTFVIRNYKLFGRVLWAVGCVRGGLERARVSGLVNVENKDIWTWFLELLLEDLGSSRGNGLTLMSDQHKSLMEVVKDVMPNAEHRQCARHIYENFRKQYLELEFRQLFRATSKASYPQLFNKIMDKIKIANPNAHKYLMDKNPKTWSRAFFDVDRGCEAIKNGFSECFNSVIISVRHKPLLTMLEAIRVIVLERMNKMR
ncbi:integrase [Tanacetum coccineum]